MSDKSFEAEQQYDHLDDLGQFDAATIREMSGHETDGENEDFTAEAIAARAGTVALSGALQHETPSEREDWIDSFHLTHPTSSGPIVRNGVSERAHLRSQINRLKNPS